MSDADIIIYGTLVVVFGVVAVLSWYAIRLNKKSDIVSRQLTVDDVRTLEGSKLAGVSFVWGVSQDLLSLGHRRMLVNDDKGSRLTEISFHNIPHDGVMASFSLDGRDYQYRMPGMLGGRMLLCDAHSRSAVLSCQHSTFRAVFYREQHDDELLTVKLGGFSKAYSSIMRNDREDGRIYNTMHPDCIIRVLTLGSLPLSRLEQCFLLTSLPGRK